ncbi:DgyrCDS819 [Dimorphilus gyrociliatus]|nr:DgyrCDS819 [Dimorphilus gyrociliatus]
MPIPWDHKWVKPFKANRLPASCPQTMDEVFGSFPGSDMWNPDKANMDEDCLYLNIWRPVRPRRRLTKAGVMVWIYGGGFYGGTTSLPLYNGRILAAEQDIIVVSINYRVGALGFMHLPHKDTPANVGLFDQRVALKWVQQHISAFGGDPKNVTLFGESAGSVSVSMHLLSSHSWNLFNRAIMQSGTANMPWATLTIEQAHARAKHFAKLVGCKKSSNTPVDYIVQCLKNQSYEYLIERQWLGVSRGIMQFPFIPVIDGVFLTEHPNSSLFHGSFKKCPIILGSNANEASFFMIYELSNWINLTYSTMDSSTYKSGLRKLFEYFPQYPMRINSFGLDAIHFQYAHHANYDDTEANLASLDAAVSDHQFVCYVNQFGDYYDKAGQRVYYYYYTHRFDNNPWPKWMGALHGDEILFIFGEPLKRYPKFEFSKKERDLSMLMGRLWVNFAKSGDPNLRYKNERRLGGKLWPSYKAKTKQYLELNLLTPDNNKSKEYYKAQYRGLRLKRCVFWLDYMPNLIRSTGRSIFYQFSS